MSDQVQTIIREKHVPVEDLDGLKPVEVVQQIDDQISAPFNMHLHTQAWKYYNVRPAPGAADVAITKPEFCRYNSTFEQDSYAPAWVGYLVRHLSDPMTYAAVKAWPKQPSTQPDNSAQPSDVEG